MTGKPGESRSSQEQCNHSSAALSSEQPHCSLRGTESLRSSDEFPANKENNHTHHGAVPGMQSVDHSPFVHCTGRKLEGVELVPEHVLAREAVYALQV